MTVTRLRACHAGGFDGDVWSSPIRHASNPSAGPDDVNTLATPDHVSPKQVTVPVSGGVIRHTLPAWSHTVLRVPN